MFEKYTARQIRLLFVNHSYDTVLSYSDNGMIEVVNKDLKY